MQNQLNVWCNGVLVPKADAKISVFDRGFLFGDGAYEVIPVYNGKCFALTDHLLRLQRTLHHIGITNPHTLDEWQSIIRILIDDFAESNCAVYLQVSRGVEDIRSHVFPQQSVAPTVVGFCQRRKVVRGDAEVAAITVDDYRWQKNCLKTTSLIANVLISQQAITQGVQGTILLRDGYVTEGAATNVFIVRNATVVTPPCTDLILWGITRKHVLQAMAAAGIAYTEAEISYNQLCAADEIWLTSSMKEILAITTLNNQRVGHGNIGNITAKAGKALRDYIAQHLE